MSRWRRAFALVSPRHVGTVWLAQLFVIVAFGSLSRAWVVMAAGENPLAGGPLPLALEALTDFATWHQWLFGLVATSVPALLVLVIAPTVRGAVVAQIVWVLASAVCLAAVAWFWIRVTAMLGGYA